MLPTPDEGCEFVAMQKTELSHADYVRLATNGTHEESGGHAKRRSQVRFMLSDAWGQCTVIHPGGSQHQKRSAIIDCSAGGLQFIWPGFVHNGTELRVSIERPGSPPISVSGHCSWCRFLTGRFHAVGLVSTSPIPIREMVSQDEWLTACAANPDIDLPLAGHLTVLAENDLTVRSVQFQVRGTDLDVFHAETPGSLLDSLGRGETDALVVDVDTESIDAPTLLMECRQRSFTGPVLFMSMDRETEFLSAMDPLARTRSILLPMRAEAISTALRDVLREHPECVIDPSPIYSDSPAGADRYEMLQSFIDQATLLAEQASEYITNQKHVVALKIVRTLAASGGSHGYRDLSDAAHRFIAAADEPDAENRLPSLMRSIRGVVARLQAGEPSSS